MFNSLNTLAISWTVGWPCLRSDRPNPHPFPGASHTPARLIYTRVWMPHTFIIFPPYKHQQHKALHTAGAWCLLVGLSRAEEKQRRIRDYLMTLNWSPWLRSSAGECSQLLFPCNKWGVKDSFRTGLDEQVSSGFKFCPSIRTVAEWWWRCGSHV